MSIRKEDNGTYTLDYYYLDISTGKKKKTKKRGFKTKAEAKAFETLMSGDSSNVMFYALYEEYQATLEQNENTLIEKRRLIERYLPTFKYMKYRDLTKPFLSKIRNDIAQLDLSPVRKNKLISLIRSTCKYANDVYDLKDNSKVMKRFKVEKTKMQIWSMEEYQRFEDACDEEYKPFFRLIFFTGLRKGEAKALKTDDLDTTSGMISIHNAMRKDISSYGSTKNPQSIRKVQLDAITLEMLKPLKSNEKWLFGDYKPFSNTTIDRHFHEAIERSGVKKIRIHDMRHSHCSILIGNGIDVVSVANRLGHSNIATTLQTYSHALENSENKIVNFLNESQNRATTK